MIWAAIVLAVRALRRNPMRTLLTTLGIVIGVAAVIATVTLGRGATVQVTNDLSRLGRNLVIARPGTDRRQSAGATAMPFNISDARAIVEEVHSVDAVAPSSGAGGRAVYGNRNWSTGIVGADNNYFRTRQMEFAMGREFADGETRAGLAVCILAETVREKLFGTGDPIGATIRVGNVSCNVVGLLAPKGRDMFGTDQDDFLVMPLVTFQRRVLGSDAVQFISASAIDDAHVETARVEIERLLRQRRRIRDGQEDDFIVRDLKEVTGLVSIVTGVLTTMLSAVAAVSLLVGGIGIMNIMMVSVTERTREIGIRLAIGARARDVLLQFLIEAIVLSSFGGALGILLGLGGTWLAATRLRLPFVILPEVVVSAFVFSAAVGVFFGFYPARRAARLNPIEALRYE